MEFSRSSGCAKLQWRYWWQSVLLVYKSVVIEPFSRLTLTSKNATFFCDDSYVNLRLGGNWFSFSINLLSSASSCVLIKKHIVNIAQPRKWLGILVLKKISLCFIHIDTGVWRSKLGSNYSSRNLLLNFVIKFKQIKLNSEQIQLTWPDH